MMYRGLMYFFQGHVGKDLYNSGAVTKDPYNNEGIWQRNGKTSSGYAPECKTDYRVGKVYAVGNKQYRILLML